MSSSDSHGGDGSSTATTRRPPSSTGHGSSPLRHRLSLEEDYFYQQLMTADPRPPVEQPPPYTPYKPRPRVRGASGSLDVGEGARGRREQPPTYSTDIELEGIWEMKMELTDAVRRADDRQWRTTVAQLRGTSLAFYTVNKEWGWGMAREWASNPDPDNPPWAKKATLLKSYNLQHADVGIAADYKKRRNVIRLRLESDQLLMSCVEPATFVKWLDGLFAALAIAHDIDERDFPVDQSVPRSQRSRLQRAQAQRAPPRQRYLVPTPRPLDQLRLNGSSTSSLDGGIEVPAGMFSAFSEVRGGPELGRRPYAPSVTSSLTSLNHDGDIDIDIWPFPGSQPPIPAHSVAALQPMRSSSNSSPASTSATTPSSSLSRAPSLHPMNRRSTTSTTHRPPTSAATPPSEISRPGTSGTGMPDSPSTSEFGKWRPSHENRPPGDDLRYARLCYAILLFSSPRKSDYIIKRQTKWHVDWESGRMTRALPPLYKDIGLAEYDRMALRAKQALFPAASMMVTN